ncbi:hypothetical protein KY035_000619 [Salmonella enterica subsp. enterica serovar Sandiego]|nr:hypothetical protein [Salmonella enterica subsp. enterica serovar Sandiego]
MIKFDSSQSPELANVLIKFNSVDSPYLLATSKRALFPHGRSLICMMVKSLTIPLFPHARARFAIQKDEFRPFETNQHLTSLSPVLSPARAGVHYCKKTRFQDFAISPDYVMIGP